MTEKLFPELKGSDTVAETCGRCGGSGDIGYGRVSWDNGHGSNRWCFQCGGSGTVSVKVSSIRARARREAKAAEERAAQAAQFAAALAGWKVEYEPLVLKANQVIVDGRSGDPLIRDLSYAVQDIESPLTASPAGAEKVQAALAALADRQATLKPVPTGRIEVTGEVLSTKWQDAFRGGSTLKMLVAGDGWKVWGTVPESLWDGISTSDELVGRTVQFTATVKASDDDASFGFFSRPTKATAL